MRIKEVDAKDVPDDLLLIADPSEQNIYSYKSSAWCFCAIVESTIAGVAVIKRICPSTAELFNISVFPEFQQQGIGSRILQASLEAVKERGVNRVVLGTGTFGHQLTFYQRNGFRVDSVLKNYFLENYSDPIEENGIQHKDMLRLYVDL